MCGIVGYVGNKNAQDFLISGLKRLEYRGYDSAGIVTLDAEGKATLLRAKGKISNLEEKLAKNKRSDKIGIGHTRWATHGEPSEANAHPHQAGKIFLVHNGIIENYKELKEHLAEHEFKSQTDTEVLAALIDSFYGDGKYPLANAVVQAAKDKKLEHEEMHTEVEYVVAHGITSSIEGCRASIGSYHFIFEDEGCSIPGGENKKFTELPERYSLLYLALSGELAAVICIEDPVREGVSEVVKSLREKGFSRIVMMTGDRRKTAAYVAEETGVDEFVAEVLPEDKAEFVRNARSEGHKVVMIGDGINDSPALSEADAGIAVNSGAAIAREIADITIEAENLGELLVLKDISDTLMKRIERDYRIIISFNSMLIALGAFGIISPATSAMLHNLSTLGISLYNMTDLLYDE